MRNTPETPRTESEKFLVSAGHVSDHDEICVTADFARRLEREIWELKREREKSRKLLQMAMIGIGGNARRAHASGHFSAAVMSEELYRDISAFLSPPNSIDQTQLSSEAQVT